MNPGYLSAICLLLIVVLGWMGALDGLLARLQIRMRTFLALLFAVYLTSGWHIPLGSITSVSVGAFVLPAMYFFFLWGRQERDIRSYNFAAALLTGVTLFLLRYVLKLDPVLHIVDEIYLIAGATAILPLVMSRHAEQVITIAGLGLCFMEVMSWMFLNPPGFPTVIGEFSFRDSLVFSLLLALLLHMVVFRCVDASTTLVRKVLVKRSR
ncbi:hypothetical protein AM501_19495 [Aneurinibacillus migulanus]|uniref:Uncharacterized protein n=1 Tax=Aneurinibacillus migulanus TaxID=47500 RepID=A0A0D1UXS2_ANEMI|nr:hypothetical protein [Aneurinibacillus migulanus]KIV51894.1 hypothetical protein TS65_25365 [Aneurinibacillus migulanus]KIV54409.1 hypothetical protein TS64_15255 [Aneurinibacillus migulanus]KON98015.1 hypothetical protein AF333_23845 [Aneurinibacillus migulanus]KPD06805.1 hypothetical protein AM501_19495 [Aneurinibacillus migulanus]MCP1354190.1 hypothetical protein [Aneurinibacillus migulanus]